MTSVEISRFRQPRKKETTRSTRGRRASAGFGMPPTWEQITQREENMALW